MGAELDLVWKPGLDDHCCSSASVATPEVVGGSTDALASSISRSNCLTRPARFCSLSLTLAMFGVAVGGVVPGPGPGPGRFSKLRAHLGGPSVEGTTHAIPARRQFEQGDLLSQRTLRERQVMQLRGLVPAGWRTGSGAVTYAGGPALMSEENRPCSIVGLKWVGFSPTVRLSCQVDLSTPLMMTLQGSGRPYLLRNRVEAHFGACTST
jgi:hypothetical protein